MWLLTNVRIINLTKGDCLSNLMSINISIKLDMGDKTISFLSENNNHMIIT